MDPFLLKLALSFIVGGSWITLATILAERFGTKIGGVLAGIPSTTVISVFFMAWTQSPAFASDALGITPAIMAIDAIFVLLYVFFLKHTSKFAIPLALLIWAILAFGTIASGFNDFALGVSACLLLLPASYYLFERVFKTASEPKKQMHYSIGQLLFRAVLSGTIIACAVLLAKLGGPLLGGAFSCFPAVFLSTMIIAQKAHGPRFCAALMKTLTINALLSVTAYIVAARYTYLHFDLIPATLLAFAAALAASCLIYLFSKRAIA
ncbi:DUF3147 family protein [Candidatus Micrarchaeota archaeon]|nr:DUF3147 family protein [Candidatus Micrarchaeota archaeon]